MGGIMGSTHCACGCKPQSRRSRMRIIGLTIAVGLIVWPVAAFASHYNLTHTGGTTLTMTNNGPGGRAIYGNASATSGSSFGVIGRTSSPAGIGVYGYAPSGSAGSLGPWAVYSQGNLRIHDGFRMICTKCVIGRDLLLPVAKTTIQSTISLATGTSTALAFDQATPDMDTGGMYSGPGTTALTVNIPGAYQIIGHLEWAVSNTGQRTIYIKVNGNIVDTAQMQATSSGATWHSTSSLQRLVVGDTIELWAVQTSGSPLAVKGSLSAQFVTSL